MKPTPSEFGFLWLKNTDNLEPCIEIRRKVFVEEQKVSENIVFDHYDDADNLETLNLWIYELKTKKSVGSARLVFKKDLKKWYIQRVSILKEFRGNGIGHILMENVHLKCKELNIEEIYVSSQFYIKDLYTKNGYEQIGDNYLEADILHVLLKKNIV